MKFYKLNCLQTDSVTTAVKQSYVSCYVLALGEWEIFFLLTAALVSIEMNLLGGKKKKQKRNKRSQSILG